MKAVDRGTLAERLTCERLHRQEAHIVSHLQCSSGKFCTVNTYSCAPFLHTTSNGLSIYGRTWGAVYPAVVTLGSCTGISGHTPPRTKHRRHPQNLPAQPRQQGAVSTSHSAPAVPSLLISVYGVSNCTKSRWLRTLNPIDEEVLTSKDPCKLP